MIGFLAQLIGEFAFLDYMASLRQRRPVLALVIWGFISLPLVAFLVLMLLR